jgi:2',3'-cyclic-nucleotide 2'-phosphodiesterase (5'-nucleotidase family)
MFIEALRDTEETSDQDKPYLLIDGGDLLPRLKEHPTLYAEFYVKAINRMGYDVFNLGDMEFSGGRPVIERMSEVAEFSLISTNVISDDPLWEPYVIEELNGVRVAVLGLLSPRYSLHESIARLETPEICLERAMHDLEGRADIFVLLSRLTKKNTLDLVQKVAGVNVAVISNKTEKTIEGERIGETLVTGPGLKGEHIGVIDIEWDDGQGRIVGITSEIHPLGKDIPDDPGFTKLVEEFNRKINTARDEDYRRKQSQKAMDKKTKDIIEKALKMTPEEFHEFYKKEMQSMQQIPESQKVQP